MKTLTEIMARALHAKNVSFRVYGPNKEYRRPMFHRFEVKGGRTLADLWVENITRTNPLYQRLCRKGK